MTATGTEQTQNQKPVQKASRLYKAGLGLAGGVSVAAGTASAFASALAYFAKNNFVGSGLGTEETYDLEAAKAKCTEDILFFQTRYYRCLAASALCFIASGFAFKKLWDTIKKENATEAY